MPPERWGQLEELYQAALALPASLLWVDALAWMRQGKGSFAENPFVNATFTRLTDYEGAEQDAAISPHESAK